MDLPLHQSTRLTPLLFLLKELRVLNRNQIRLVACLTFSQSTGLRKMPGPGLLQHSGFSDKRQTDTSNDDLVSYGGGRGGGRERGRVYRWPEATQPASLLCPSRLAQMKREKGQTGDEEGIGLPPGHTRARSPGHRREPAAPPCKARE